MNVIAEWNSKKFIIDADMIYGISSLSVQRSIKAEAVESSKALVYMESTQAGQITVEVELNALLGVDVQSEMKWWMDKTNTGQRSAFKIGGVDYLGGDVMITTCQATDIKVTAAGVVYACKLKLTFKEGTNKPAESSGSITKKKKKPTGETVTRIIRGRAALLNAFRGASAGSTTSTVIKSN